MQKVAFRNVKGHLLQIILNQPSIISAVQRRPARSLRSHSQ